MTIQSETFTGNEKPEGFDASIRDAYSEGKNPYSSNILDLCPVGGARKDVIVEETIVGTTATQEPKAPHEIEIPVRDTEDAPTLYAWYGGWAYSETYRKVVLAQCREIVRAKSVAEGVKLSEARTDDLARLHPIYLGYLAQHLDGRVQYEAAVLAEGGMR